MTKYIAWITASLVSLIALGSFVLSYNALKNLAALNGLEGWPSYIWPFLIILPIVIYVLGRINNLANYHVSEPKPVTTPLKDGIIYIMRRSDGILKFGKTNDLNIRRRAHRYTYQKDFEIVASWVVSNVDFYEKAILRMSGKYKYTEGKKPELRKMNEHELNQFILDFSNKIKREQI